MTAPALTLHREGLAAVLKRVPRWARHLLVLAAIGLLCFLVNPVPIGTFVAQGDYFQSTRLGHNLSTNLFTWFHLSGQGQANTLISTWPYYAPQALLTALGASTSTVATSLEFAFLAGSYLSMLAGIRIGLPAVDGSRFGASAEVAACLAYALNPVTFNVLSQAWGYLHHNLFYVFAPVLLASTWRVVVTPARRAWAVHTLLFALSTVTENNLAWLFVLILLQVCLALLALVTRRASLRALIWRSIRLYFVELLCSSYVVIPVLVAQRAYVSKATTSLAFGGDVANMIRAERTPTPGILAGAIGGPYHFPRFDLIGEGGVIAFLVRLLAPLPFLVVLLTLARPRRAADAGDASRGRSALWVLVGVIALFLLVARQDSPAGDAVVSILTSGSLVLLRSPEKVFVLLPLAVLLALLAVARLGRPGWVTRMAFGSALIAIALPFLSGGISTYLGARLSNDFLHPDPTGYSQAVRLPPSYTAAAMTLNADSRGGALVSLPYSSENSINWSNYPGWGFVGANVLSQVFDRPVITADTPDHPALETAMSFEALDAPNVSRNGVLHQLQRFGARYVIFHLDVPADKLVSAKPLRAALDGLVRQHRLNLLRADPMLVLYQVPDSLITPLVALPPGSSFTEESPVDYSLVVHGLRGSFDLRFLQSENVGWKLFPQPWRAVTCPAVASYQVAPGVTGTEAECSGGRALEVGRGLGLQATAPTADSSHRLVDDFANSWILDPVVLRRTLPAGSYTNNPDGSMDLRLQLYYQPQSYFYDGLVMLALIVLAAVIVLLLDLSRSTGRPIKLEEVREDVEWIPVGTLMRATLSCARSLSTGAGLRGAVSGRLRTIGWRTMVGMAVLEGGVLIGVLTGPAAGAAYTGLVVLLLGVPESALVAGCAAVLALSVLQAAPSGTGTGDGEVAGVALVVLLATAVVTAFRRSSLAPRSVPDSYDQQPTDPAIDLHRAADLAKPAEAAESPQQ